MMHFTTDQQTLNDLTIFGKPGSESIFSLFNRALTRGGTARLEDFFRYPIADPIAINNRSKIIEYFASTGLQFPFKVELFDVIEQYLENTDERSKLPAKEISVTEKLKGMIAVDPHFKNVNVGVMAIRALLNEIEEFLKLTNSEQIRGKVADANSQRYQEALEPLRKLLEDPELNGFLKEKPSKTMSYAAIAEYDILLRFRMSVAIRGCLLAIYQLDAYLSVAKVALQRGFCYPMAIEAENQEVILEGVYHPHVKGAIANSLRIDSKGNIIFLTGANMAGKSTLMKSLGIAMYLAHMGFPIPAEKMNFSVREGIYTSINLPDNLSRGMSHFYAEVLRIKKVSRELGMNKNLFIIIDELFRGTNVKDAYEATVAITSAFARKPNCMFVMSTHIMEAGDTLRQRCDNINFVYLPTKMDGNRPVYTYCLKQGITADRHGMIIINNEGILDILNKKL